MCFFYFRPYSFGARLRFSIIKYDNAILQGESAGRVIK